MFRTFVINLNKDKERMAYMSSQLTLLNIEYQRQEAVLGKDYIALKEEYDEDLAVKKGGHRLLPGEIGCALSHVKVLEKIVNEKIPYSLILEDDVRLPNTFKVIVESEISKNESSSKWEYLLFDYMSVGKPFLKLWFKGIKENYGKQNKVSFADKSKFIMMHILKALYMVPLSLFERMREIYRSSNPGAVKFYRPVYFAGAYLVTYKGAEKLLSLARPIMYTADHLPNIARIEKGLKFRCYSPLVVKQKRSEFGSSILDIDGKQMKTLLDDL